MGRMSKTPYEERKKGVYEFLQKRLSNNTRGPSYREIAAQTKINSTSVIQKILFELQEEGRISLDSTGRSIRLPKFEAQKSIFVQLKGTISAGAGVVIPESGFEMSDPESLVEVPSHLLPRTVDAKSIMALKVQGDSMEEDGVLDGDIVILQATDQWSDHDMVAVWQKEKGSATLKRIISLPRGNQKLVPSNRRYIPWVVGRDEYIVQGKVFAVLRNCWKSIR